jgi:ribonucleoside-diphosphate reductase alpha chain
MPKESDADEISSAYMEGWRMGLKAVAIYRDGSKRIQPVNLEKNADSNSKAKKAEQIVYKPYRKRLAETRNSITHKFSVAGHEGYLTVGLYEDRQPGELFITMAKEGSTVGGLMDVIGTCVSMSLQYGVPLLTLVEKFRHARFEPAGMTSNKNIPFAKSLIDYIFCWMGCQFIVGYAEKNTPNRIKPAPIENKNTTTAKTVVEKTEALAKKIDEAKAIQQKVSPKSLPSVPSGHAPRISDPSAEAAADRVVAAVGAAISGQTQGEMQTMAQFNEQFTHFQDDAPACDVCGSICVRNGTCYRCFNCGNSMGCS